MGSLPRLKTIASTLSLLVPLYGLAPNVIQTYAVRNGEEVEVLSLVVAAEIKANKWAGSELRLATE
jgi:hypothetical protein